MDVFWCGKPELYFESVQILFMVIAFYAALWLTVMASTHISSVWKFLSILPAIMICCFFFYIVKTAALLKAVYVVDTDAMLEVIEETEAAKQLSTELRDAVLARLETTGEDPFNELQRLYNEIDVNRSDSLSRREFGQFMELMGISFSVKKWERIYKEIDRNYDNEISLNEFLLFLYPDHDIAVSMENKRLKAISQRVMDRANNLMSHLTPLTEIVTTAAVAVGAAHERRSTTIAVTPAQRRRSVVAHIHPNMSRQNSVASSNGGSAPK
jgi:Ca2+-binding EF-hand superfamily protein